MPGLIFLVDCFVFFKYFEYIILLSPDLQSFCQEISWYLMGVPLHITSHFSPAAFKILFAFDFWQCNYYVSWCSHFQVLSFWGPLNHMNLNVCFSTHVWEVFVHYFLSTFCPFFFFSSFRISIMHIWHLLIAFYKFSRVSSLFFIFQLICLWVHWFLLVLDWFCCWSSLLNSSVWSSVITFFSSRI